MCLVEVTAGVFRRVTWGMQPLQHKCPPCACWGSSVDWQVQGTTGPLKVSGLFTGRLTVKWLRPPSKLINLEVFSTTSSYYRLRCHLPTLALSTCHGSSSKFQHTWQSKQQPRTIAHLHQTLYRLDLVPRQQPSFCLRESDKWAMRQLFINFIWMYWMYAYTFVTTTETWAATVGIIDIVHSLFLMDQPGLRRP